MTFEPTAAEISLFQTFIGEPDANGCRDWRGTRANGYGRFRTRTPWHTGHSWPAHRFAFGVAHGFALLKKGMHVCHACDRPSCVEISHLWLGSAMDNQADAIAKGRNARGSRYPNAKLTENAVREIRASGAGMADAALIGALMAKFNVGYATIRDVIARKSWKHVRD